MNTMTRTAGRTATETNLSKPGFMSPMDELFNTLSPEELAGAVEDALWAYVNSELTSESSPAPNAPDNVWALRTLVEALKRMSRS